VLYYWLIINIKGLYDSIELLLSYKA